MTGLNPEAVGAQIRGVRQYRGLSMRQVSVESGSLSAAAISRIEKGQRSPTLRTLVELARVLGVSFTVEGDGLAVSIPLERNGHRQGG